ncbi:MAG: Ku protein [Phycisphaerales bacterium]|nr:Ku protein [Phycisphaerales bacterium]
MSRPIWKGHISFGLVNVPVTLHTAERRTDLQLHMLDSRDHARVRYERVNEETGEEVPWGEVVRGYEYKDGSYVVLSDEELKRAAPEATKRVEIEAFVGVDEIDPMYFDRPYYLEPGRGGEKGYVLLREALAESGRVGIARVVIRTRQYIAAMMARGDMLVLELLRYPQELRSAEGLEIPRGEGKKHGVTAAEKKIARTLVDSMSKPWDPAEYTDEYREDLMQWIEKKVKSGKTGPDKAGAKQEEDDEPPAPISFMDLLRKSIADSGGDMAFSGAKKGAKRSGARKAAAKKKSATKKKPAARRKAG